MDRGRVYHDDLHLRCIVIRYYYAVATECRRFLFQDFNGLENRKTYLTSSDVGLWESIINRYTDVL